MTELNALHKDSILLKSLINELLERSAKMTAKAA